MTAFRACLTIIKRRIGSIALYFAVFLALSLVIPRMSGDLAPLHFSQMKPNYTIINRDIDSPLSEGLSLYLKDNGNEIALEDEKSVLQDATFFDATDYIIIIPNGFSAMFWAGEQAEGETLMIETVATTETAKGYYLEMLVNQYLGHVRLYQMALGSPSDSQKQGIIANALDNLALEATVETRHYGGGKPIAENYYLYVRMVSYITIALIILSISNITAPFRRPDLRMRNLSSPVRPRTHSIQQFLAGMLVCMVAWLALTALGFILYGGSVSETDWRYFALIMLNTAVMTLLSLSLATLASVFIKGSNAQNAVANILSLGLCFLGGVFVPLELFGEGLLVVARFTPIYWYTEALERIYRLTSFGATSLAPIWQAMLTQLIFAAAFFCLGLAFGKHANSSERYLFSNKTELEA